MILAMLAVVSQESLEGPLFGPVGFIVAFFVGTVSFFSPCILPLVPGYIMFVTELSGEEIDQGRARRRVLLGVSLFVLGFATIFTALGATASVIGATLIQNQELMNRIAGSIVIVMGLAFLVPGLLPFLEREGRPFMSRAKPGLLGAFPLGLAFAAGWTPCIGPGLGVMLNLGGTQDVGQASLLLFFFSLGFGVWFILAGLGMRRALAASEWLKARMRWLQVIGGVSMVTIGVLLVTDYWNTILAPLRRMINQFSPPV